MAILIAGLVLFFLPHSVSIVAESWRERSVARIGEGPWQGLYSLVAAAGFALIIWGYAQVRTHPMVVYVPPHWLHYLAVALLAALFPLLLATYLPGRIKAVTVHPMLSAVMVWGFAHLLANGTLADLLLFGSFLAWAVADRISMTRRVQRPIATAPPSKANDLIAVVAGLLLYAVFLLWLHKWLFGVSPLA